MSVIDLTNMSTKSRRIPEIDSLYVYSSRHKVKFNRHLNKGAGYRYMSKGVLLQGGIDEIYDYSRSVTIFGITMSLVLVTKNSKFREVQQFFNEQVKAIEADQSLSDKFCHAKSTPTELGLYFTY